LDVVIDIEQKQQIITDLSITQTEQGWVMVKDARLTVKILTCQCLDLAGNANMFDTDTNIGSERLVGCGN